MPRKKILIPRNSTLPAKGSGSFKTRDDNQQTVAVNVIEGGDASGRNATKIGTCVVSGLPADLPAKTPVEVRFQYLENGRLTVEAWLPETKSQATLEIKRAAGLSEEKMTYWANWLSKGPILIPSKTVADEDEDFVADGSQADVEEEFEPAAAEEQEFDFESFEDPAADESPSADKEPDDITIGEEAASDEEMAEDSGPNLFEGLVTDDAGQEEDGVDTDDSDLANFLRRDSQ
jgi:molecular chaperone DnaK (HSP70)